MPASFNRVVLVGNVTRDPEVRYIPNGMGVAEIGLAVNDRRKDANGDWKEETTFVDVTLWGRTAQIAQDYAKKGSSILIEGRLKLDSWEKDGQKFSKLRVVGERLVLLGSRGGSGGGGYSQGGYSQGGYNQGGYQQGNGGFSSQNSGNMGPSFDGPGDMGMGGDDVPF